MHEGSQSSIPRRGCVDAGALGEGGLGAHALLLATGVGAPAAALLPNLGTMVSTAFHNPELASVMGVLPPVRAWSLQKKAELLVVREAA